MVRGKVYNEDRCGVWEWASVGMNENTASWVSESVLERQLLKIIFTLEGD